MAPGYAVALTRYLVGPPRILRESIDGWKM